MTFSVLFYDKSILEWPVKSNKKIKMIGKWDQVSNQAKNGKDLYKGVKFILKSWQYC